LLLASLRSPKSLLFQSMGPNWLCCHFYGLLNNFLSAPVPVFALQISSDDMIGSVALPLAALQGGDYDDWKPILLPPKQKPLCLPRLLRAPAPEGPSAPALKIRVRVFNFKPGSGNGDGRGLAISTAPELCCANLAVAHAADQSLI
jgi:hypothetical protein